jgi:hypothetical protein
MEQLDSNWTDFREILYLSIFRKSVEQIQFHENPTRITGTLQEEQYAFFIIRVSRSVILRMRNVSDKSCRENQNTHSMFNNYLSKIGLSDVKKIL